MHIEHDTAFGIGDKVYPIKQRSCGCGGCGQEPLWTVLYGYSEEESERAPATVATVLLKAVRRGGRVHFIETYIMAENSEAMFPPEDIFKSFDEARAECSRRAAVDCPQGLGHPCPGGKPACSQSSLAG